MENRYLELLYRSVLIQVKLEDDGVVLDVFNNKMENVATTSKLYEDFGIEQIKEKGEIKLTEEMNKEELLEKLKEEKSISEHFYWVQKELRKDIKALKEEIKHLKNKGENK